MHFFPSATNSFGSIPPSDFLLSTSMSSSIVLPSTSLTKFAFCASKSPRSSSCVGFKNEIRRVYWCNLEKSRVFMSIGIGSEMVVLDDALFKNYKPSTAFLFPGQATFTGIVKLLAKQFNADLMPRKSSIKLMIQDELTKLVDAEEAAVEEDDEGDTDKEKKPTSKGVKA